MMLCADGDQCGDEQAGCAEPRYSGKIRQHEAPVAATTRAKVANAFAWSRRCAFRTSS